MRYYCDECEQWFDLEEVNLQTDDDCYGPCWLNYICSKCGQLVQREDGKYGQKI